MIVNVDECNASQHILAFGSHSQLVAGMVQLGLLCVGSPLDCMNMQLDT